MSLCCEKKKNMMVNAVCSLKVKIIVLLTWYPARHQEAWVATKLSVSDGSLNASIHTDERRCSWSSGSVDKKSVCERGKIEKMVAPPVKWCHTLTQAIQASHIASYHTDTWSSFLCRRGRETKKKLLISCFNLYCHFNLCTSRSM